MMYTARGEMHAKIYKCCPGSLPKFCQFFSGSHADLIATGGEYCRMYNLHLSRLGMNDSTTAAS